MFEFGILRVRPIESTDLSFMYEIRTDDSTSAQLGTLHLKSSEEQLKWLNSLREDKTKLYLILELSDSLKRIGYLRLDEIDWINRSMRVGGDIASPFRDKGYGTAMMELIGHFCFRYLNMHRLWLLVLKTNVCAKRVYEKTGFKKEGVMREAVYKDGIYIDYEMYSLLKGEFEEYEKL